MQKQFDVHTNWVQVNNKQLVATFWFHWNDILISLKTTFETEPAELEDHMDDLPLVEDLLNVEKSEILDTKSPSPTAPEEPLSLNCTDCDETFSTVSELRSDFSLKKADSQDSNLSPKSG